MLLFQKTAYFISAVKLRFNITMLYFINNSKRIISTFSYQKPKLSFHFLHEKGIMLVEVILMAIFLGAAAIGITYFLIQTKTTMSSSSQVMECQVIVKQALEDVISLGTRLYGYKIKHSTSNLNYTPLFITKNTKGYDVDDNIKDVGDGSELAFPPQMYQELYKNVVGMDIDPPIKVSPQSNTGEPIISDVSTYPIEISTSVLFVNSANALQYLYNSDSAYSTGDGKLISTNNGLMSSMYQKYKERFGLDNIQFYVKTTPLRDGVAITTRPILTRPRFPTNSNEIPLDLIIQGDENIGFEIKVKLKYELNGQNFNCEGMHKFRHQRTGESGDPETLNVDLKALANGAGKDFLATANLLNTSCDTHGSGYDDMTLELDFNTITESQQVGTVILCQMNSYCRSEGDDKNYGNSCSPEEEARWQRCHDIQPKPSSDQSWTLKSKLKSKQVLTLQFDDMKINRRYDLNIAEFAMDGEKLRTQKIIFYIDARRPYVDKREITDNDVGSPTDDIKGRNYKGPFTYWKRPADSDSHGKWLQCNTEPVDFQITMDDQFTHNLKNCDITWTRKDGVITTPLAPLTSTFDAPITCRGKLSTIQHGRQTITFQPKDTCEPGPWNRGNLVWDTDLPISFEAQDFTDNPEWLYSSTKDTYPIKTEVPTRNDASKFPKHYSVDCDDNFQGSATRLDGNSDKLECRLSGSVPDHDDGCNPNLMGVKYYHVCGGTELNCNRSKEKKWAVYTPHEKSCANVRCEPDLACCDANSGTCGVGVIDKHCGDPTNQRHCSNTREIRGGRQSKQNEGPAGCPPLGLNNCDYSLPCETTNHGSPTDPCNGQKEGEGCSFTIGPRICGDDEVGPCFEVASGTCGYPSGGCSPKGHGGNNLSQEQCNQRDPICTPTCDSSTKCCPGDTPATNPTHCQQTECVRSYGLACCGPGLGGTCTGSRFCIKSYKECHKNWWHCNVKEASDGVCRPRCGMLSSISEPDRKYRGWGLDCLIGTEDDPRTVGPGSCAQKNKDKYLGSTNWRDVSLVDGIDHYDSLRGWGCCVRDIDNLPIPLSELEARCRPHRACANVLITAGISTELSFKEVKALFIRECGHLLPPPLPEE